MKKVLFTATTDSFVNQFLGPYLNYFKKEGYEVHVATSGNEVFKNCDKKHIIPFERNPFKNNNLKSIKKLKKIINKENYEIIHAHTPMGGVVTRMAAKDARKRGTKVIYTAHGFHFFKGAPAHYWLFFYPVEKYMSKYTDDLITINKEDYQIAKRKFKKTRVHYVAGVGIDKKKFDFKMTNKEKTILRSSLGLDDSDFILIFPAELNKNKNQILLINVMEAMVKKHNNIHLLLPGIDSYKGQYQNIVEEKNLIKNIHFLGYRKDIPKLLKISNLAVSSSKREGLPVNLLEAMYVGLPMVVTDCRGNRDLVENGKTGYIVDKTDTHIFQEKILKIYNDVIDKKFSKISSEITKKYLLESIMKDMVKIYKIKIK